MTNAGGELAEQAGRLAARADQVALCLDFDGTLSPIVPDPEAARPLKGMVELLGRLASRFAAVALVSGRPADFLAEHASAPGVRYLGLYGLQEIRDDQVRVDPRLEAGRPAVQAARQDLRDHPAVQVSGAWLEDKWYAVAVHTRRVADPDRWAGPIDQAAREIATRHGLEVVPGKLVWELRPHRAQLAAEGGTPGMLLFLHPRRARRIAGRAGYWSWLSSSWSRSLSPTASSDPARRPLSYGLYTI
jgi:trehalose 6-phosphate phosphatase